MLRLRLSVADLAGLRFAFSPLWEVVASLRVLAEPGAHPLHLPWIGPAARRLAGIDVSLLADLVPVPTRTLPGFLAPTPAGPLPDLDVELAELVRVPTADLRDELGPDHPLAADPAAGLARLTGQIRAYWDAVLAPDWPRVRSALEGDVLHRGRQLAGGGPQELFADLDPGVRWQDGTLTLRHPTVDVEHELDGRGLVLVPSAFTWPRVFTKVDPRWPPVMRYPCRGTATLWDPGAATPAGLAGVLGGSRARLLAELAAPATTTDLAVRTGLTAPGVSQHLAKLRAAGLVSAHRSGSVVLYARTAVADALLG